LVQYSNGQYRDILRVRGACLPDTFQKNTRRLGISYRGFRKNEPGFGVSDGAFQKKEPRFGISNGTFQKNEPTVGNPAAVFGKNVGARDFLQRFSEK
jgi:hypothetical protein